jgi:hypothetical protein
MQNKKKWFDFYSFQRDMFVQYEEILMSLHVNKATLISSC